MWVNRIGGYELCRTGFAGVLGGRACSGMTPLLLGFLLRGYVFEVLGMTYPLASSWIAVSRDFHSAVRQHSDLKHKKVNIFFSTSGEKIQADLSSNSSLYETSISNL